MFALLDWIKIGGGALAGILIGGTLFYNIGFYKGDSFGRDALRAEIIANDMKKIEERGIRNEKNNRLDGPALCRDLGGKWVQSNSECQ